MICPKCENELAERCYTKESEKFKEGIKKDKGVFLFNFSCDEEYLKPGKVDLRIRNEFDDEGIHLSNSSIVSKIGDKKWRITDGAEFYLVEMTDEVWTKEVYIYKGERIKKYYKSYIYECFSCGYRQERESYVDVPV